MWAACPADHLLAYITSTAAQKELKAMAEGEGAGTSPPC